MDVVTEESATKDMKLDPKESCEHGARTSCYPVLGKAILPSCSQELDLFRAFRYEHSKWGPQG